MTLTVTRVTPQGVLTLHERRHTATRVDDRVVIDSRMVAFQAIMPLPLDIERDTTPPSTPTSLLVTDTGLSLILTWLDPGESDLHGVRVYRSLTADGSYDLLATVPPAAQQYEDDTAAVGVTYYYRLTAVDASLNESTPTSSVAGVIDDAAPPPPSNVAANGGEDGVTLTWVDAPDDDLDRVRIYRSTDSGGPYLVLNSVAAGIETYLDSTAVEGVTYYYVLTSIDAANNESDSSELVSAARSGEPPSDPAPDPSPILAFTNQPARFTTGVSLAAPLPTFEATDLMLAAVMHRSTLTPPSGWILIGTESVTGPASFPVTQHLSVYGRVMEDTDPSSVTWTQAESERLGVAYLVTRGPARDLDISDVQTDSHTSDDHETTPHPLPTVTVEYEGSLVVAFTSDIYSASDGGTWGTPPHWTLHAGGGVPHNRLAILSRPADIGTLSGEAIPHTIGDGGLRHYTAEVVIVLVPIGSSSDEVFLSFEAEGMLS